MDHVNTIIEIIKNISRLKKTNAKLAKIIKANKKLLKENKR